MTTERQNTTKQNKPTVLQCILAASEFHWIWTTCHFNQINLFLRLTSRIITTKGIKIITNNNNNNNNKIYISILPQFVMARTNKQSFYLIHDGWDSSLINDRLTGTTTEFLWAGCPSSTGNVKALQENPVVWSSFVLQTWYQHPMSNQQCQSTEGRQEFRITHN